MTSGAVLPRTPDRAPGGFLPAGARGAPSLSNLSWRDAEIVNYSQRGLLPHDIAEALGHDRVDVMRALNRALRLGMPIRPEVQP